MRNFVQRHFQKRIKLYKQTTPKTSSVEIFPLILSDNIGEFSNVYIVENDEKSNCYL